MFKKLIITIFFICVPAVVFANGIFDPPKPFTDCIYDDPCFVCIPAKVGGLAVGLPFGVVGAIPGSVLGLFIFDPVDGAKIGIYLGCLFGDYLGQSIFGLIPHLLYLPFRSNPDD